MKPFSYCLIPFKRVHPHPLPVENLGYSPSARHEVDFMHQEAGFCFILSGAIHYRIGSRQWHVPSPCVLTLWPGIRIRYGAKPEMEEFFVCYNARLIDTLQRMGYANPRQPVWTIRHPDRLSQLFATVVENLEQRHQPGVVDRIDRLCEQMLFESKLNYRCALAGDRHERTIHKIQAYLERHYLEPCDFNALAQTHGMSPSYFRHHWSRFVSLAPSHFVTHLRIQHSCRLLLDTDLPIKAIADIALFDDPLYFSRMFHQYVGESASAYRARRTSPGKRKNHA